MLSQWHLKDHSHSAKRAGGRLCPNLHTSLTQHSLSGLAMLSRHSVGTYQGNEVKRNSWNAQLQSSQLTELLWTDPGLKGGICARELISTLKNF